MTRPKTTVDLGDPRTHEGVIVALGALPLGALVTVKSLAGVFGVHEESVRRAVRDGQLPEPATLLGERRWTVASILAHMERRIAEGKGNGGTGEADERG